MITSVIRFDPQGEGHCLYSEALDLPSIGTLQIARATNVEFNHETQEWEVRGLEGQLLFSNRSRNICLDWEQQHFNR